MSVLESVGLLFSSLEDCVPAPTEIGAAPGLDGLAIYVERLDYLVEVDLTLLAIDGQMLDLGLQSTEPITRTPPADCKMAYVVTMTLPLGAV